MSTYKKALPGGGEATAENQGWTHGMISAMRDPLSEESRAYYVNRDPEGAAKARARASQLEALAAGRGAPTVDRTQEHAGRSMVGQAMQGFGSQLAGTGPTMALAQGQRALDTATGAQMGAMSARPGSALAQRAALMGAGRMAGQGAQQAAGTRLAELGAAGQGFGSAALGQVRGDTASMLGRAGLELDQRRLNDELAAMYAKQGIDVGALQMGGARAAVDARQDYIDTHNAWNKAFQDQLDAETDRGYQMALEAGGAVGSLGTSVFF